MQENPYDAIAQLLRQESPGLFWRMGPVLTSNPLSVEAGGLKLSGQGLFCNAALLSEPFDAEISLPGSGIQEANAGVRIKKPLQEGDRVLLCSDGDQVFYVICKVVGT